ncbi:unnamed protein product [Penicillium glandicola]
MRDTDHPKPEDHVKRETEETKPINFEWTPELVKLATSRGAIHPSIGPIEYYDGEPCYKYRPGMTLPDPADTRECLRWVGLSDKRSSKGYIERGIQLGLRPEFAVFCGLHEDDPRAIAEPYLFEELWFIIKGPAELIEDNIIPIWMELKQFMASKLLYDGKAWSGHGKWVVREGETLEQAKARLDDRERQRLRDEAIKENEAILKREKQERDREHAEDLARWAEEDRQAGMP